MSLSKITEILSKKNLIIAVTFAVLASAIGLFYNWLLPNSMSLIYEKKITKKVDDSFLFGDSTVTGNNNQNAVMPANTQPAEVVAQVSKQKSDSSKIVDNKKTSAAQPLQDNQIERSLFNPDFKTVSFEQMLKIIQSNDFIIIDARQEDAFKKGHIPRSVNIFALDEPDIKVPKIFDIPKDKKIIVYCDGGQCDLSHALAKELRDAFGFKQVFLYEAGWEEWSQKYKK